MEYDFRKSSVSSYDSNASSFNRPSPSSAAAHPSLYPKVAGASHSGSNHPPYHNAPSPPPSASMMGIRVSVKPQYRITPPPTLLPQMGEVPRSNFHFDFGYERNVIAESMKEKQNWSRFLASENIPQRTPESSSNGPAIDPVVSKYLASGLTREAVTLAVANFGDNPIKVKEFAKGFSLLREMGFSPNPIAEALIMYDNDADKALAHFLNNTS
ncbi:hypothetical protein M569_04926 [Genlisea aurea]|uniref:UBA domain-containing protein n=1 Tax=Genlisea aurea TaxID=192259 RepID=S8CXY1_9LAMI|nr:hypothetical protein M569_04926 [Genlisea aurea]